MSDASSRRVPPGAALDHLIARFIEAVNAYHIHSELSFDSPISYTVNMLDARDALRAALDAPRALARFDISDLGVVLPDPAGAYVLYDEVAALDAQPPQQENARCTHDATTASASDGANYSLGSGSAGSVSEVSSDAQPPQAPLEPNDDEATHEESLTRVEPTAPASTDPRTAEQSSGAVTAAELKPEWQPIETAPTDGRRILAVNVVWGTVRVTWWDDAHSTWAMFPLGATHWMPLPDPPAQETGEPRSSVRGRSHR